MAGNQRPLRAASAVEPDRPAPVDDPTFKRVPLAAIVRHPKNPRHDAVADEETLASIRELGVLQALVGAPHPTLAGHVTLIGGHCRLDALRRIQAERQAAGDPDWADMTAPVLVRTDLTDEGDQLAAMLAENGRRRDLSPIEEAEGYGQLRFEHGWKPGQIAKQTGRSLDTVNKRLRLLKLGEQPRTAVHAGEITIDDALALAELPEKEQTKVQKHAGHATFKNELYYAKQRAIAQEALDAKIAELKALGVEQKKTRKDSWQLNDAEDGMVRLSSTFSRDPDDHPTCLAFIVTKPAGGLTVGVGAIEYVCTNNAAHDEQLDEERRKTREDTERRRAEEKAHDEAEAAAKVLRTEHIRDAILPGTRVDDTVLLVLRTLLPAVIWDLPTAHTKELHRLLDIPAEKRWGVRDAYMRTEADEIRFNAFVEDLHNARPGKIIQALVCTLLATVEGSTLTNLHWNSGRSVRSAIVSDYLYLIEELDGALTDVDRDRQKRIREVLDNIAESRDARTARAEAGL